MVIHPFEVYLVTLDPTMGSEINKTRPCVVISPIEMNRHLNTVIVAPLTSTVKNYPSRVDCVFARRKGQIVLDQMRAVDNTRLIKKAGAIKSTDIQIRVSQILREMFAFNT